MLLLIDNSGNSPQIVENAKIQSNGQQHKTIEFASSIENDDVFDSLSDSLFYQYHIFLYIFQC